MVVGDVLKPLRAFRSTRPTAASSSTSDTHRAADGDRLPPARAGEASRGSGLRRRGRAFSPRPAPGSRLRHPFVGRRTELDLLRGTVRGRGRAGAAARHAGRRPGGRQESLSCWRSRRRRSGRRSRPSGGRGAAFRTATGSRLGDRREHEGPSGHPDRRHRGPARRKLARLLDELITEHAEWRWVEPHLQPLVGVGVNGRPDEEARLERSRPGGASSRRPPPSVRSCSLSRTSTGRTPACSTSSTTLWSGRAPVPLLVLCTARPELFERRPAWGGGKPNALALSLPPLGNDETAALIAELSRP